MERPIENLIRRLRDLFLNRQKEQIADLFTDTLPVYCGTDITIRFSRADTVKSLDELFANLDRAGATQLDYRILEIEDTKRADAATVRMEWLYQDPGGKTVASCELKYFWGRDMDGAFRCLMVEYLTSAFDKPGRPIRPRLN